jgi:hypothetical protein
MRDIALAGPRGDVSVATTARLPVDARALTEAMRTGWATPSLSPTPSPSAAGWKPTNERNSPTPASNGSAASGSIATSFPRGSAASCAAPSSC